ncbi:MAG: C39 family peptidase [bacterium]|nr:C39 family peptidase [bacterium]
MMRIQHLSMYRRQLFLSLFVLGFFITGFFLPQRVNVALATGYNPGNECCLCRSIPVIEWYNVCRPETPDDDASYALNNEVCNNDLGGGLEALCVRKSCSSNECVAAKMQSDGACWKCTRSRDEHYAGDDTVYPKGTFCYPKTGDQEELTPPQPILEKFSEACTPVQCASEPSCNLGSVAKRAPEAHTVRFEPSIGIPGTPFQAGKEVDITPSTLSEYIAQVFKFLVGMAGLIALIMIMLGGYRWVMARGAEEGISGAKSMVVNALAGLALALVSYTILQTINPGLVNLAGLTPRYVQPITLPVRETESVEPGPAANCPEAGKPCIGGQDGVPLYKQGQMPWRTINFGRCDEPTQKEKESYNKAHPDAPWTPPTYAYAGCGAMSVAMVLQKHGDDNADKINTPTAVGDAMIGVPGVRICGQGSNVGQFITERGMGKILGAGQIDEVLGILKSGQPVIAHVGCIKYKKNSKTCLEKWKGFYKGHYIVLTGIDAQDNNKIHVNDSAGGNITEIAKVDLKSGIIGFIVINPGAHL